MTNPKSQWPWPPWEPVLKCGLTALDFFPDECTQPDGCYSMGLCSSDDFAPKNHACSQCIRSFKENTRWGKTKTRKVQKGNSQLLLKFNIQTTCSNPFEGCLLSVCLKDHLRTSLMSRTLSSSHWHLPLCHHEMTPALVAVHSLRKPDETPSVPGARVLELSGLAQPHRGPPPTLPVAQEPHFITVRGH